jgi:hypothetical protein
MLEHYSAILETMKNLCTTAHIGGGAVRDSLVGKPFRDIDLFLHDAVADDAAKLLRSKFAFVKVGQWESYEMFSDPAVSRVAKFEKADEAIPVCIIGLKQPRGMEDNLARFDFGACMAGFDGNKVYTAPEYRIDISERTYTLCRADDQLQFNYSMLRFSKLAADRYAGWKLVVPAKFEALAREYTFKKAWYCDHEAGVFHTRDGFDLFDWFGPNQLKPKAR